MEFQEKEKLRKENFKKRVSVIRKGHSMGGNFKKRTNWEKRNLRKRHQSVKKGIAREGI